LLQRKCRSLLDAHVKRAAPPQNRSCVAGSTRDIDCDDRSPGFEFALIILSFVLWNTRSHECTDGPGNSRSSSRIREDDPSSTRRDSRTDDRDCPRQNAEPGKGTWAQTGQGTGQST
jgi:hypothetical protein